MTAGPMPRRRSSGLRWMLAALILLPLVEIVVLVAVGRSIGLLWTIALLVGMALVGAWLARRETGRTLRALQRSVESGRMPTDEATDAILVVTGGFLLILPGFLSDVIGLLLVLPFTRPVARRLLQHLVARQAGKLGAAPGATVRHHRTAAGGQIIEGEVVSEESGPGAWPGRGPSELER